MDQKKMDFYLINYLDKNWREATSKKRLSQQLKDLIMSLVVWLSVYNGRNCGRC